MKQNKSVGRRRFRNDLFLVCAILLIAGIGILYLFVFRESGNTVVVKVDGKIYGRYLLSENATIDVRSGEDGMESNVIVIENGKVYVKSATCPDGICVGHRPIFRNGESIICLPNRVVITVIVDNDASAPDVIA